MRIYKALLLSSLFMTLIYSCSLPADDEEKETYLEEEDNATAKLPWEGETDKFTINAKEGEIGRAHV